MAEPALLDRTFGVIMNRMVETGQAPHFTEIADQLGVSPREGRTALHELFSVRGFPGLPRFCRHLRGPAAGSPVSPRWR
jgi:hypothetical protein